MIGVATHDYFDDISDADVRRGVPTERRDRMLQTFVRNHYSAHLREILLTLQNEYTDWTEYGGESPAKVKEQVRKKEEVQSQSMLAPQEIMTRLRDRARASVSAASGCGCEFTQPS